MADYALERRVAHLENALRGLAGSQMVSRTNGTFNIRPYQVGFPAKLTSVWDATTGYSWKQEVFDQSVPGIVDQTSPLTGQYAVEIAGRTDLAIGQLVWLEVDPQAGGYIAVVSDGVTTHTRQGIFADLTAVSGGLWKYQPLTLNSSGVYVNDGSATTSFKSSPLPINGTVVATPSVGDRVLVFPSKQAGFQEFVVWPIASTTANGFVSIVNQDFSGNKNVADGYVGAFDSITLQFVRLGDVTWDGVSAYGVDGGNFYMMFDNPNSRIIFFNLPGGVSSATTLSIYDSGTSAITDGATGLALFSPKIVGGLVVDLGTSGIGTWSPTFTNLTVVGTAPTINGKYTKLQGSILAFTVEIIPVGTVASVAGSTYCDVPSAVISDDVCIAADGTTFVGLGTGFIRTTGRIYIPSFTATTDKIVISGKYKFA